MTPDAFDLVVIGSGPAGEKGAAQAAYFGKRVALVEKEPNLGGAGVNTGTVPSKTLRETALYFSGLRQRGLYGVDYTIKKDITVPDFMFREREVVRTLWDLIEANMERHHVTLVRGLASFDDPHTIRVRGAGAPERVLTADFVLIATGSTPHWPEGVPRDPERLYDSDTILRMDRIPRSMVVVGGGVIGCEYATMFRALGIEVTLVAGGERLLPFLDFEIADRLHLQMDLLGLKVVLGDAFQEVAARGDTVEVRLKSGGLLEADRVLFAAGRGGATRALGLEQAGLSAGPRGHLAVNEHYQTAVPHIYAAGDVIGFPALASTSMEQGRVAMCHAFDLRYKERVSPLLPMAVYTIPEIAAVGETEEILPGEGDPLLRRPRRVPRQQPRADHRGPLRPREARLRRARPEAPRRAHRGGDGLRARARRPGLPALRRDDRLLHPGRLQLPDPRRGLQVRRLRRPRQRRARRPGLRSRSPCAV